MRPFSLWYRHGSSDGDGDDDGGVDGDGDDDEGVDGDEVGPPIQ